MSTRAQVVFQTPGGSFRGVYMHYDGYPSHRGIECLAMAQMGYYEKNMNYQLKYSAYPNLYEKYWPTYENLFEDVKKSDWEWCYIRMTDGTWKILDVDLVADAENLTFNNTVTEIDCDDEGFIDYIEQHSEWGRAEIYRRIEYIKKSVKPILDNESNL